jgi:hypothetical protein
MWDNPAMIPFKSLKTKAVWAKGCLGLAAVFFAVYGLLLIMVLTEGIDTFIYWDEIVLIETVAPFLVVATGIAFVVWSFNAHKNLRWLGRDGIRHSDQATFWWWFVPIANLFMPFRVIYETVRGSLTPAGLESWRKAPLPQETAWWTGLFICGVFLSQFSAYIVESAGGFADLEDALPVGVLSSGSLAVAAVLAMRLVGSTTEGQSALASGSSSGVLAPAEALSASATVKAQNGEPLAYHDDSALAYCTQCGKRFADQDRFCGSCGGDRSVVG